MEDMVTQVGATREEWLGFLDAELARRDARAHFLYALTVALGVAAWFFLSSSAAWATGWNPAVGAILGLAGALYLSVGEPLFDRIFGIVHPSQLHRPMLRERGRTLAVFLRTGPVPHTVFTLGVPALIARFFVFAFLMGALTYDVGVPRDFIILLWVLIIIDIVSEVFSRLPLTIRGLGVSFTSIFDVLDEDGRTVDSSGRPSLGARIERQLDEVRPEGRPSASEIIRLLLVLAGTVAGHFSSGIILVSRVIFLAISFSLGFLLWMALPEVASPQEATDPAFFCVGLLLALASLQLLLRLLLDTSRSLLGQLRYGLFQKHLDVDGATRAYETVQILNDFQIHPQMSVEEMLRHIQPREEAGPARVSSPDE